jgi:hypothetical protein
MQYGQALESICPGQFLLDYRSCHAQTSKSLMAHPVCFAILSPRRKSLELPIF